MLVIHIQGAHTELQHTEQHKQHSAGEGGRGQNIKERGEHCIS